MHQHQEKQKMIQIANSKEAKKVYEDYMKTKDPKALTKEGIIHSYEIDNNSLYYNPMGGIEVTIYINHDKKLDIQFGIVKNNQGELEPSGYTYSKELSHLLGE
ncbi:hypothetical protein SITYG_17920 [Streptococcus intermedius]|uniref:DUF1310 family protein n=1 Tax=Streptococcus intermedius TaxID=1338 RepID=A0A428EU70_STRIT|nr:DUF1310 family protein [Streptococcus intermedius]RSJ18704.1 hypothetical protein D8829_09335 [Streptococcus intermedius]BAW17769.1 hypothetical protein SITYG_17920 [Streptococcus intermedius]